MKKLSLSMVILPLVAGIVFLIFRIPSLFEPHWYGDEGVYQVVGRGILSGKLLYQEIWDNKPPLLYLIYALFNGNLFLVKMGSLIVGLASVGMFYLLSQLLFKKSIAIIVSLALFAFFFATPIIEGNIANAENFMLLPIISSAFFIIKYIKTKNNRMLLFAGFLLSISFGIKVVSVFDFQAFVAFIIIAGFKLPFLERVKSVAYFSISFLVVIIIFAAVFLLKGAFVDFINAVFLQNVSYVGVNNNLILPMGVIFAKFGLLTLGIVGIIFFRKRLTWQASFIYIWTLFSLFNIFFSERPYTHYVLLLLPSVSLLFGLLFDNAKYKFINVLLIIIVLFTVYKQFPLYEKSLRYYENFLQFVFGGRGVVEYRNFFDGNTSLVYEIAQFIQERSNNEEVFLWSDAPQIYVLANKMPISKYVVSYHVDFYEKAYEQTIGDIQKVKPKYIIQTTALKLHPEMIDSYDLKYIIKGVKIYERAI